MYWYREAAEQGYAEAQYYLGFCYAYGYGIEKDLKQAEVWYHKAVKQGHAKAREALKKLKVSQ